MFVPLVFLNVNITHAQYTTCQAGLQLLKDGKVVTASKAVSSDDYSKYKLRLTIKGCNYNVKIVYTVTTKEDSGIAGQPQITKTSSEQEFLPSQKFFGETVKDMDFGKPQYGAPVYKYTVQHLEPNKSPISVASLSVIWSSFIKTDGTIKSQEQIDKEKKEAGQGSTTPTENPGPKGKKDINTDIKVSNIPDFDDNLGRVLYNPLGDNADTIPEIIAQAIRILLAIVAILSVIMIIVAGFRMVLSSGNESQVKTAKATLMWAIIGLVVSLLSFSLVALVQYVI